LLSGPVESIAVPLAAPASGGDPSAQEERIARLEAAVAELGQQVAALRKKIDDLFA
jgi:uncharacterized protein YceH (UPF0502 family)